ncbi:MAG: OmpA family protein [Leptolyngbyaceae cyanobacterium bins.349]|nr:OmpA family protein [Leptolyngbyaceae cyanobacterium bins.349]
MNQNYLFLTTAFILLGSVPSVPAEPLPVASPPAQTLRLIVNSNQDTIQPDAALTLREAISIVNGTLPLTQLSDAEKAQTSPASRFAIEFNLPTDQTTIQLTSVLPPLRVEGMAIDGTTQPGYKSDRSAITELPMPIPIVALTPAPGQEVFRGLSVEANNITIRGLSLYGFTSDHQETASTPPADIFIAHPFAPPDIRKHPTPANFSPFYEDDLPARRTVIENNWIGIPPSADGAARTQGTRSAFGVSVFNGENTIIRRNWIADHEGSGIITAVNAERMEVTENVILSNGLAGMPDAIRLEGEVDQAKVTGNVICGNDGSAIYLFKPAGAVEIRNNQISFNGRRLRRAAVYLMGGNHTVQDNKISYQAGPGVVVAAYPTSERISILANQFLALEGLSIDLVTQQDTGVLAYQKGDGPNPPRNSFFRRLETGNAAIDAPQFTTQEFVALGAPTATSDQSSAVEVFGKADPGSKVELYRVVGSGDGYGALNQAIATVEPNENGDFSTTLNGMRVGDQISAIATHPLYGTSEPAVTATIRASDGTKPERPSSQPPSSPPRCVTAAPPPVEPPPVAPIILKVPRNVHFALDRDVISPASARVLDRVATVLRENPTIIIELQGHTDPRASDAYNLALGARRARNTRNYLLRQGIAAERMTIRSFGERQRATQGSSKIDYARDRRVEIDFKDARDIEVIVQEEDLQIEP